MLPDYELHKKTDKKFIVLEFILILIIFQSAIFLLASMTKSEEAIQFRILAHSNTVQDQLKKEQVKAEVLPLIQQALDTRGTQDEFVDNLRALESTIIKRAESIVPGEKVTLASGYTAIPPKRSGFFIQPQADYNAVLLTIGSGRGDNWWCALFQNICFPEEEEREEEAVTFFLWEWIKGLFS